MRKLCSSGGILVKTILLIDDDRALTKRNKGLLEYIYGADARILVAYTAKKVLELAKEYRIDVFVMDILGLDDKMDGIELAEILREKDYPYPVPIIIASKKKNDTYKNEVHKRIKFYDYITKPYEPEELSSQIKYAIRNLEYRPNPYFEINQGSHTYRTLRKQITHIEKVYDKRKVEVKKRDESGEPLRSATLPIVSFKSFVEESVENDFDFVQCDPTIVVNLYWVERYCDIEKCVILRICGTKIHVTKKFRDKIKKIVLTD